MVSSNVLYSAASMSCSHALYPVYRLQRRWLGCIIAVPVHVSLSSIRLVAKVEQRVHNFH